MDEPTFADMLDFFHDFLQEEHSEIDSVAAPAVAASSNQDAGDESDDGWETMKREPEAVSPDVGEAAEKESLDDGQTSCNSFDICADKSPARGSNRYQKRQREELKYLKRKVRELEDELRRVDQENRAKQGDSMWQHVAQQQSVARQQAVSENTRLKLELEEQLKFSKSLEKMIRKRSIFHDVSVQPPRRRRKVVAASLNDKLYASAAAESLRVDRVLLKTGMAAFACDRHDFRVKSKPDPASPGGDILRIEMLAGRRFPFPYTAVADVVWGFLSDASNLTKMGGMNRDVHVSENALLTTTTFTFPVGDHSAEINASCVIHKRVGNDFVVLNWVSDGECKAKHSSRNAFKVVEKGWTKIEPLPGDGDACILRSVNQFNPTVSASEDEDSFSDVPRSPLTDPDSPDDTTEEIGILTELMLGAYARAAGQIYTQVQNVLMQQMVAKA